MRARLALYLTGKGVELREILLKEKPKEMLAVSPKGTVPVMTFTEGQVLQESLDIMLWAVQMDNGRRLNQPAQRELELIERNDNEFKHWLDRYKYQVGYPEHPMEYYRDKALVFLNDLEVLLGQSAKKSLSPSGAFADIAIFPFVRQFAFVDKPWFDNQPFKNLRSWLDSWINAKLFAAVMHKYPQWQPGEKGVEFAPTPFKEAQLLQEPFS